jgi:predicted MFS family arabinose efflux permease
MLGLFLLLPVLALYARDLPDYSPEKLGLAMGAYGLTQALLQIPFGRWSDRFGRKPVIAVGLLLYALGSLVGALGHSLAALIAARSIQGAGAVSAAVTALLADLTRVEVRTRAMAFIGISIGLSFVLALVAGPVLDGLIGVSGIFLLMLALAAGSLALLYLAVPGEPARAEPATASRYSRLWEMLWQRDLWPLYFGILALHFVMTSTFLSVPQVLEGELGIASPAHWKVYLGVFIASLLGTVPMVLRTERGRPGPVMFALAIVMLGCAQAALGLEHSQLWPVLVSLAVFFAAFNYLEARLPALLTQLAPGADRGAALGIFATAQFLGAFLGGALGGVLLGRYGLAGVFWGAAAMALIWLLAARVSRPRPAVLG